MNNWIILPILIPLVTAALLVLVRHQPLQAAAFLGWRALGDYGEKYTILAHPIGRR